jgi:hypothetical protein
VTATAVLLPVFVQVALTFVLLIWMGVLRVRSLREGKLCIADIALGERNWPPAAMQAQNSFHNQFELPLLFYVLIVLALITQRATLPLIVLSWMFVMSRTVHALIHVTGNDVPRRFWAYVVGMTLLIAMWLWFAWSVIA